MRSPHYCSPSLFQLITVGLSRVKPWPTEICRSTLAPNLGVDSLKLNSEASKHLDIAKSVIDDKTTAVSVAEIYKKSAELNEKRGNLNAALADFEKYIIKDAVPVTKKDIKQIIYDWELVPTLDYLNGRDIYQKTWQYKLTELWRRL